MTVLEIIKEEWTLGLSLGLSIFLALVFLCKNVRVESYERAKKLLYLSLSWILVLVYFRVFYCVLGFFKFYPCFYLILVRFACAKGFFPLQCTPSRTLHTHQDPRTVACATVDIYCFAARQDYLPMRLASKNQTRKLAPEQQLTHQNGNQKKKKILVYYDDEIELLLCVIILLSFKKLLKRSY